MILLDVPQDEFLKTNFEQKPRLFRSAFRDSSLGWHTIDQALDLIDPTYELLKVLAGGRVDPSQYVEEYVDIGIRRRRIDKAKLYNMVSAGATLVLNRIEFLSAEVREICLEIGRLIGAQTTSNAYACLGGEPATNVHWDTHDVMVVQFGGRKHWRIYEPTHALPISSQVSNDRKHEVPDTPVLDEVLESGDILYVPRGWWHQVVPVEGSDTLHLTVAIHTPLILDYLVWACGSILPELPEVRHSLLGGEQDDARIAEAIGAVAKVLTKPAIREAFYARSQQRERVASPFDIAGLIQHPEREIPAGAGLILNVRNRPGSLPVFVNGKPLGLDGEPARIVRILSESARTTLGELRGRMPDMSPDQIDQLVRDLARRDVLQITGHPGEDPVRSVRDISEVEA